MSQVCLSFDSVLPFLSLVLKKARSFSWMHFSSARNYELCEDHDTVCVLQYGHVLVRKTNYHECHV